MLFTTIDFIIFFTVVLISIIVIKNRKFQHLFLLFSSYFFFYYTSNYLIILIIFTTFWDFYFGLAIWKSATHKRKKMLLVCSLIGNLGLLGFYKYADFTITQINFFGNFLNFGNIPLLDFALPMGISFYTFHSITYTVGIYRGIITPVRLREYALFVAFFPQLVAGPILRANQFLPQLREKIVNFSTNSAIRQIIIENQNLKLGITIMAMGFFKKMVVAENITILSDHIFNQPLGAESFTIIIGALAFGIQIYCDFSGYSDIAIGAALVLGFKFPENFNRPYFATSPADFWRRWHISLSTWLRDYLYIPLGGNRGSKFRTYFNLIAVMFIGGLWHGASWNFVIWGLLHGMYLAIHKLFSDKFPGLKNIKFFNSKIGKIISILVTQYFIFLAWIAFRVQDTNMMFYSISKYLILDFQTANTMNIILQHKIPILIMILFALFHIIIFRKINLIEKISNIKLRWWFVFLISIMTVILLLYDGEPRDFIYFKF